MNPDGHRWEDRGAGDGVPGVVSQHRATPAIVASMRTGDGAQSDAIACAAAFMACAILIFWLDLWSWIRATPGHSLLALAAVTMLTLAPLARSQLQKSRDLAAGMFARYSGIFRLRAYRRTMGVGPVMSNQIYPTSRRMVVTWFLELPEGELVVSDDLASILSDAGSGEVDFARHQKTVLEVRGRDGETLYRHYGYRPDSQQLERRW